MASSVNPVSPESRLASRVVAGGVVAGGAAAGSVVAGSVTAGDSVPEDLRRQALLRFKSLLYVFLALHVAGVLLNILGPDWLGWEPACSRLGAIEHGFGMLLSVVFMAAIRSSRHSEQMLNYGLAYQVITCFVAAYAEQAHSTGGLSFVAVLILLFPMFVPRAPWKTLVAGLLSAVAAPLGVMLYHQVAGTADALPGETYAQLIANFVFAGLAVVPSQVMARFTRELKSARRIGAYELTERVGQGGMGEVWRAQHRLLRRPAAVKLIRQGMLSNGSAERTLQRFEREAQATADLESPHTVELYDFGVSGDGSLYYVMELLSGIDLETAVKQHGPMSPERVVHLLKQMCDSLDDAHRHGLLHRDIKPANVLICRKGRHRDFVKVVDFGLVRPMLEADHIKLSQTAEGNIQGTPAYLSPEAVTGDQQVDARSDLYALGCVAYYLLTGRLVFEASSPVQVAIAHATREAKPPSALSRYEIPPWLDQLILACLEKDPRKRPQSALEVAEQLAEHELKFDRPWTADRARAWWQEYVPTLDTHAARVEAFDATQRLTVAPRVEVRLAQG